MRQPVMPIMAARPLLRSTLSLKAFSAGSEYRFHWEPPMSPGALEADCFTSPAVVPA